MSTFISSYRNQIMHPVAQCNYCNRHDIESSGRSCRLSPDDEEKTWFCCECCANMQKHEYGICTMDNKLYMEILQKLYKKNYESRYGKKSKQGVSQSNPKEQNGNKKNKPMKKFTYKEKKAKKPKEKKPSSEHSSRKGQKPADNFLDISSDDEIIEL